jgi:hypothetical protein
MPEREKGRCEKALPEWRCGCGTPASGIFFAVAPSAPNMNSPEIVSTKPKANSSNRAVAPAWHTLVVLVALVALSLVGALSGNLPGISARGRTPGYILVTTFEWAIVAFIWYGISRRGVSMKGLVAGRWVRPVQVLRDCGIAMAFIAV